MPEVKPFRRGLASGSMVMKVEDSVEAQPLQPSDSGQVEHQQADVPSDDDDVQVVEPDYKWGKLQSKLPILSEGLRLKVG